MLITSIGGGIAGMTFTSVGSACGGWVGLAPPPPVMTTEVSSGAAVAPAGLAPAFPAVEGGELLVVVAGVVVIVVRGRGLLGGLGHGCHV